MHIPDVPSKTEVDTTSWSPAASGSLHQGNGTITNTEFSLILMGHHRLCPRPPMEAHGNWPPWSLLRGQWEEPGGRDAGNEELLQL